MYTEGERPGEARAVDVACRRGCVWEGLAVCALLGMLRRVLLLSTGDQMSGIDGGRVRRWASRTRRRGVWVNE